MKEILSEYSLKELSFPEEVEVNIREKDGKRLIFINNFSDRTVYIDIKKKLFDLISEKFVNGELELSPFGVMILED